MSARSLVIALASVTLAACSIDWRLARGDGGAGSGASGGGGGAPVLANAALLCDRIPSLSTEPVVDGKLESGLSLYTWLDEASRDTRSGVSANVSLAYRPDGVYFFAAVVDPTRDPAPLDALPYCGDGVELYVDDDGSIRNPPGYDRPGTMQLIVAAPSGGVAAEHRGERFVNPGNGDGIDLGAWSSSRFAAVPTADGYVVEAFVVATDLDLASWRLAPGAQIGWNLSLNIGGPEPAGIDACTTRSQQIHFRLATSDACTAPFCNASAFCATALLGP
ncbi:MAG TPA: hypothetical protein VFQ35_16460 [Polyangiaceae bacterium]|nr:hypothetical protein [Polyangiaceae bacterium]